MKFCSLVLLAILSAGAAGSDIAKGNRWGTPGAPLLIEVFSDFECPACKAFHDELVPKLMADYVTPGKAYLVYRYYPLAMHAHGRQAAELVSAAAEIGKYREVAEALFAHQAQWSADGKVEQTAYSVLTAAEQQKVRALLKTPAVQGPIDRDMEEGRQASVSGTPTLLVTYRLKRYPVGGTGVMNYTLVKALLDDLLKK